MRLVGIAALCLASCAPHPAQVAVSPITQVSAEVKSWGVTMRRWTVDGSGQVEHVLGGSPGVDLSKLLVEVRRTRLSSEELQAVRSAVARAKAILAEPAHCDLERTDGPYGNFRWTEDGKAKQLSFSANCESGRDARLAGAIFDADEIVSNAARRTEPVQRRPYQE